MRKLKTLEEHDAESIRGYASVGLPRFNGIECPKCKSELVDSDNFVLTSNPPKKNISCPKCCYRGYAFL